MVNTSISLTFTAVGWITTVQDLGRVNSERTGIPTGGAADQHSASVANILVGNERRAPLIETLGATFAVVPSHDVLVAVTGTPASVTVDHEYVNLWEPVPVPAGAELRIENPTGGARSYIAVAGDLQVERLLGSAAPDARMGFRQALTVGTELQLSAAGRPFTQPYFNASVFHLPVPIPRFDEQPWTIDVVETAEIDTIPGIRSLVASSRYVVTGRSDHVGLRLSGPVLHPADDTEIVSHGVPIGALEVPHDDELIVLGRYRTLTAGYPVIGVAASTSLPKLGQASAGRQLTFRWIDRDTARQKALSVEMELRRLERRVSSAFSALGIPTRLPQRQES